MNSAAESTSQIPALRASHAGIVSSFASSFVSSFELCPHARTHRVYRHLHQQCSPHKLDPTSLRFESNMRALAELVAQVRNEEEKIREGGGPKAIESQHAKARLTARERIHLLVDPGSFFELGLYAANNRYEEWGGAPAAGVITGLARIDTRMVMLIVNDATVKAGAFFPMTAKKVIRAQNIAIENRIPTVYLV